MWCRWKYGVEILSYTKTNYSLVELFGMGDVTTTTNRHPIFDLVPFGIYVALESSALESDLNQDTENWRASQLDRFQTEAPRGNPTETPKGG